MTSQKKTPDAAGTATRANEQETSPKLTNEPTAPKLLHIATHYDAGGTAHAYCGHTRTNPNRYPRGTSPHIPRCPACRVLYDLEQQIHTDREDRQRRRRALADRLEQALKDGEL